MKPATRTRRAMVKLRTNSHGENNGLYPMAQEITSPLPDAGAAPRYRLELSSQTQSVCTISAETFGNGASTLTKEVTTQLAVTGACNGAAHGVRASARKGNPPIET